MKKLSIVTTVAAALSAAVVGLAAPALAGPSGAGSAQDTISRLEADGNRVIVHRLADTPLADAEVVAVQPGPDIRNRVWDADHDNSYQWVVTGKVYYVNVR